LSPRRRVTGPGRRLIYGGVSAKLGEPAHGLSMLRKHAEAQSLKNPPPVPIGTRNNPIVGIVRKHDGLTLQSARG
jgi:hypothetical protein